MVAITAHYDTTSTQVQSSACQIREETARWAHILTQWLKFVCPQQETIVRQDTILPLSQSNVLPLLAVSVYKVSISTLTQNNVYQQRIQGMGVEQAVISTPN